MSTTPNLTLPYILAAQSQKHVTHNEAVRMLDALVQITVLDRNVATPPASPAEGARYIVAASPTGAWAGQANSIAAFQDGAWAFFAPKEGWIAWVADEDIAVAWSGTAWMKISSGDSGSFTTVGINAAADTTNRLSLASAASLFNHAGAGHQQKINKAAAGHTASQLFQTNFSGRAEWGLNGSDDMSLKVSADGTTFSDVFTVDRATQQATFAKGALRVQVDTFTASGTWTKPVWAKEVDVILVGAGGGGGSGRRGPEGTLRIGGSGGAAGAVAREVYAASDLPASMSVEIGVGGTGGAAVAADGTNGSAGAAGGATQFRDGTTTYLEAPGGAGGAGGGTAASPDTAAAVGTQGASNPGAGALDGAPVAAPTTGISLAPGGGGSGGRRTTGNAYGNAGAGGAGYRAGGASRSAAGGAGSLSNAPGGDGGAKAWARGTGGGGGGGSRAFAGGLGGTPGGGGGGGAASVDGTASGAGGAGARGEAWIISVG